MHRDPRRTLTYALVLAMPIVAAADPDPEPDRTAADVAGNRQPGDESGRSDEPPRDSTARRIGRGVLFLPKLVVEIVLAPFRTAVWVNDRYHLGTFFHGVFFNDAETIGLYPTAAYESGFGGSIGARFVHRDVFGDHEHFALQASTGAVTGELYREAIRAELRSGDRFGRLGFVVELNFDQRPSDPFYGIGNGDVRATPPPMPIDARTDSTAVATEHRYQEARAAAGASLRITDAVHVVGTAELTSLRLTRSTSGVPIDEIYAPMGLVGFDTSVNHVYGELELRWDTRARDSKWEPTAVHGTGSLVSAYAGHVAGFGAAASFSRFGVDAQHYWRIAKGPRVLIARLHGEVVTGTLDEVPFTELPALGGSVFLRGYTFDRFRDRVAALGSLQYQWDLSHVFDAYVFADAGRVFPSLDGLTVHDMRLGYGIGLDLHGDRGFIVETAIATSIDGGVSFSISFNPVLDERVRWR